MNVTLKGLPAGNAELHYAAKVEPNRQGALPRPAALLTKAVGDGTTDPLGTVTFDLTRGIEYVVFGPDGKGRNVLYAARPVIDSLSPATAVNATTITLRVLGGGFSRSSRIRFAGTYRQTTFVSERELNARITLPAAATVPVVVENAGTFSAPVNFTIT